MNRDKYIYIPTHTYTYVCCLHPCLVHLSKTRSFWLWKQELDSVALTCKIEEVVLEFCRSVWKGASLAGGLLYFWLFLFSGRENQEISKTENPWKSVLEIKSYHLVAFSHSSQIHLPKTAVYFMCNCSLLLSKIAFQAKPPCVLSKSC